MLGFNAAMTVDYIPSPGTPDTTFERLSEYVSAIDPAWVSRTRGVDAMFLQRYLDLAGRPTMPESFRQTARSIGVDAGGLFRDFRVVANLQRVVSLYEDHLRFQPQAINRDFPVVATYIVGDQISLDLRTHGEPALVDTASGELVGPRALRDEARSAHRVAE